MTQYIKKFLNLNKDYNNGLYAVKTALVKYMADKGVYFDVLSSINEIFDDFTFDNIISLWAKRDIHILNEEKCYLNDDERYDIYTLIIDDAFSFENENSSCIGRIYEQSLNEEVKKNKGVTYTPEDLCEYMISLVRKDIKKDDKLLDPACGCGIFLEGFYNALMSASCEKTSEEVIFEAHKRILNESIYGCDTSQISCAVSKIILSLKYPICVISQHIYCCDSLLDIKKNTGATKFDWVITNPPYIGHKKIEASYRHKLAKKYDRVYYDKADISYCFFMLGYEVLKKNGRLLYLTSRYFAESKFAEGLRDFILEKFSFLKIVDFYGVRPFKTAGIDPMIIYLKKSEQKAESFPVVKYSSLNKDMLVAFEPSCFNVSIRDLSLAGFNFLTEAQRKIVDAIEGRCEYTLEDIVDFFQGMITGCDKAFVISSDSLIYSACIDECGKKWLKGKDLKDNICFRDKYVLYTNGIKDISRIMNTIKRLKMYKDVLSKRRECVNSTRKFYELQWGRNSELFDNDKVIFAYKGEKNNFLFDDNSYYFSADIYAFKLKDEVKNKLDTKKLIMLLNSAPYDRYFKTYAKKLGGKLYEYYPNTVCKMKIPSFNVINSFTSQEDIYNYFHLSKEDVYPL